MSYRLTETFTRDICLHLSTKLYLCINIMRWHCNIFLILIGYVRYTEDTHDTHGSSKDNLYLRLTIYNFYEF